MQSTGAGAEIDISRLSLCADAAIPQACAAVNALLAIERGHTVFTASNRLAGTHLYAKFGFAFAAQFAANENHVIGVARWRLHASAEQQGVLVRDQELSVKRNLWPAAAVHDPVV